MLTWDILYDEGVVISAAENGEVTDYTYGLERISASTGKARTEYVYDGRGSVIGEVTKSGLLSAAKVTTKAYTPFGEQIGEAVSGFGWNSEYYNAATGQVYLRARFYEPEMNRFCQKDILRGSVINSASQNRYLYCQNDPVNFIDPSGMIANWLKVAAGAVAGAVTGAVAGAVAGGVVGAVVGGIAGGIAGGVAASAATKTSAPPASNPPSTSAQTQAKKQEPTPTPTPTPHPQPTPAPSPSPSPYSPYVTAPDEGSRYACDPQENSPGSTFGRYLLQSLKAFVFGDYSEDDATWLSIGGSMAAGIFDVDLPLDVRDFIYDVSHTGELERPVLRIGVDVIAFLPVIGALKYTDDVADVVKQTDNIADAIDGVGDAAKQVDKIGDAADAVGDAARQADKIGDAADAVGDTARQTEKISDAVDDLPKATFSTSKLQHEYKHAEDFGITGNWNSAKAGEYQKAIENHIDSSTDIFKSTYRGEDVYVYYDSSTGLGAYTDLQGNYIGGWKFSDNQVEFHFNNGERIR